MTTPVRREGARDVVLYELNEVPWLVLDRFVTERPHSHLRGLLDSAKCETTINDEQGVQPWRSWPTIHTGLPSSEHRSLRLGEDPAVFRGEPIWVTAESAGLPVGLFGVLQSWPPHKPHHGGFYVPDTFSLTDEAYPPSMRRFQRFNLAMTKENAFSPSDMRTRDLVVAALDMLAKGMTLRSSMLLAAQLINERRDSRHRAARSVFQALPSFDLYWRLHRRTRPALSIFFTNHVAGMMHRFWGDLFDSYAAAEEYTADPVYAQFILQALDIADRQVGRILHFVRANPQSVLIVASSIGQGPIPYRHIGRTIVLRDHAALCAALNLPPATPGLAMYPMYALTFGNEADAESVVGSLKSVAIEGIPLFPLVERHGTSVTFRLNYDDGSQTEPEIVQRVRSGPAAVAERVETLGLAVEERTGGGNTAFHTPEGPFITWGAGISGDSGRRSFPAVHARDRILSLLGLQSELQPAAEAAN
jgi:hypothetical protein